MATVKENTPDAYGTGITLGLGGGDYITISRNSPAQALQLSRRGIDNQRFDTNYLELFLSGTVGADDISTTLSFQEAVKLINGLQNLLIELVEILEGKR